MTEDPAIPLKDRMIVALDMGRKEALALVGELREEVGIFKVGLELFVSAGPEILRALEQRGVRVFLDLKLLDIPETVRKTLVAARNNYRHVVLATIHVFNRGLADALWAEGKPRVLAVTLLTNMDEQDLSSLGIGGSVSEFVIAQTQRSLELGCAGVIASGQEVQALRQRFGSRPLIVTPGIRPAWAQVTHDDQKRIVTPGEALRAGADHIVVGRPVTAHPDPRKAVRLIKTELAETLAGGAP